MISMGKSPNDLIYFRLVKYSNLYNRSMSRCFLNVHEFPSMSRWNVPTNSVLLNSRGGADQHRRTWKEQPDISFAGMMRWNMRMSCYFSFKPIQWNRSPRMVLFILPEGRTGSFSPKASPCPQLKSGTTRVISHECQTSDICQGKTWKNHGFLAIFPRNQPNDRWSS